MTRVNSRVALRGAEAPLFHKVEAAAKVGAACICVSHPSAKNAEEWGTLCVFAPAEGGPRGPDRRKADYREELTLRDHWG